MKLFLKRKYPTKVFFKKQINVRSFAYGKHVLQEFLDWKAWFLDNYKAQKGDFILSLQKNIYGKAYDEKNTPQHLTTYENSCLPPLVFDSMRFEVGKDGFVCINGQRSSLNVGSELKAWAITTILDKYSIKRVLFVIGKRRDDTKTTLSVYEFTRRGFRENNSLSIPLDTTLETGSFLIGLGRHILLVHNSILDYYYYHYERGELQRVAIGADGKNEDFTWCKYVCQNIVVDDAGRVFWQSDNDVYGFRIGSPANLLQLKGNDIERVVHICSDKKSLLVYRKNKNTGKTVCVRYTNGENDISS